MKMNGVNTNLINLFAFGTVEIQDFPVDLTKFMAMTLSSAPLEERDSDCMKDWTNLNRSSEGRCEEV